MKEDLFPCRKCICVPICKHRGFASASRECSILNEYFYEKTRLYIENTITTQNYVETVIKIDRYLSS